MSEITIPNKTNIVISNTEISLTDNGKLKVLKDINSDTCKFSEFEILIVDENTDFENIIPDIIKFVSVNHLGKDIDFDKFSHSIFLFHYELESGNTLLMPDIKILFLSGIVDQISIGINGTYKSLLSVNSKKNILVPSDITIVGRPTHFRTDIIYLIEHLVLVYISESDQVFLNNLKIQFPKLKTITFIELIGCIDLSGINVNSIKFIQNLKDLV